MPPWQILNPSVYLQRTFADFYKAKENMEFESSPLYLLIKEGSKASLFEALHLLDNLSDEEVSIRSTNDRSTYLHHIANQACKVWDKCATFTPLIPIIYKLAVKNINVNGQNTHGNTCLHLACLKPKTEGLCEHFIRIGVDPCILNKKNCRVIHTYRGHKCHMVKGQNSAKSGIWNAVETEDLGLTERLLNTWCRVDVKRNKSLYDVADETGNIHIIKMLNKYAHTNEMAINAFACNASRVRELIKTGDINLSQCDESRDVARPLVVAIRDLGEVADPVMQVLQDFGQDPSSYESKLIQRGVAFETSDFYLALEEGSDESLIRALELSATVDVTLTSTQPGTEGWTYLHYIVHKYTVLKAQQHKERLRIIVRILYRLALHDIDVNSRDANEDTALILAGKTLDHALMTHLIRIGCDPFMTTPDGKAVNEEVYEDKGKLVFDRKYRPADLPGLWVAVQTDDVTKANRWLSSWCRVNTRKGDRRLLEVARDLNRTEIVKLLETYEHINEFVCATFACDLDKMMNLLALGRGQQKVNTIDDFFHVGFTWDRHAEFLPRPIIISAMEICTPEVVNFLLDYGADLSSEYEESFPCGPVSFWAFRDRVDNQNAMVVAKHADVQLQDELGCTLLHKVIQKKQTENKIEIIQILLERGVNIAARDCEGSTARDYIAIYDVEDGEGLRQIIDNSVFELINNDLPYQLENLIIESYDHISDIRGTKKNKSIMDIAELKELKEILALMDQYEQYKDEIALLHQSAKEGDLMTISKLSGEKRCAWSKDKAGRTLLHNAVLYEHPEIVTFLVDNQPNLINSRDNLLRTPLHYCVCLKERAQIWPILQDGGADPSLKEVNNLSVYEYVRELETPTLNKDKPRGRRTRDYRVEQVIDIERTVEYGGRAARYELHLYLSHAIPNESISDITLRCSGFSSSLELNDLDAPLLKLCVDHKRGEVAKLLIETCGARSNCEVKVTENGEEKNVALVEYARKASMEDLVAFLEAKITENNSQQ